jgi:hypothetical protein
VVKSGAEGEKPATDVMEINRLGDLADIANLVLTLAETKQLRAGFQQGIVATQVRDHAARRPACSPLWPRLPGERLSGPCGRDAFRPGHSAASPFSLCACGGSETGIA